MSKRNLSVRTAIIVLGLLSACAVVGCAKKPTAAATETQAPVIPVSRMVERMVTDFADYTGRTDAVLAVNVRARATGYLRQTRFDEGGEVKKGDLLFVIEPEPYDIAVASAKASVDKADASLVNAQTQLDADKIGFKKGVVSDLQIVSDEATVKGAQASLDSAKESLRNAKLNLSYCNVFAEIDGQVSRYNYTPGNLVTADQTLLTTIVSTDSMYAYFDIEEKVYDKILQEISKNPSLPKLPVDAQALRAVAGGMSYLTPIQRANFPVKLAIEGQPGFPYTGSLDFINNQVSSGTGTVAARGFIKNIRAPGGLVSLLPGRFVRVRLPLGHEHNSQLIIDRAIGSDQGIKFVYVVGADNKVKTRPVVPGALQEDGLREIEPYKPKTDTEAESGVKPDEVVVVGALQQLKPGLKIQPEIVPMPTTGTDPTLQLKQSLPTTPSVKGEKGASSKKGKS